MLAPAAAAATIVRVYREVAAADGDQLVDRHRRGTLPALVKGRRCLFASTRPVGVIWAGSLHSAPKRLIASRAFHEPSGMTPHRESRRHLTLYSTTGATLSTGEYHPLGLVLLHDLELHHERRNIRRIFAAIVDR